MSRRRRPHVSLADLAGWRTRHHVNLASVSAATKIPRRYLEAIEAGDFHALPGGVYNLSYLRQYAEAIHYDADELIDAYCRIVGATRPTAAFVSAPPAPWAVRVRNWVRGLRSFPGSGGIPQARE